MLANVIYKNKKVNITYSSFKKKFGFIKNSKNKFFDEIIWGTYDEINDIIKNNKENMFVVTYDPKIEKKFVLILNFKGTIEAKDILFIYITENFKELDFEDLNEWVNDEKKDIPIEYKKIIPTNVNVFNELLNFFKKSECKQMIELFSAKQGTIIKNKINY